MDSDIKNPPASLLTQQSERLLPPRLQLQTENDNEEEGPGDKLGAVNSAPHSSVNAMERFKLPLNESPLSDDDDVWFEARDHFTNEVIAEPCQPLTSSRGELPPEMPKHLQSQAEPGVPVEGGSSEVTSVAQRDTILTQDAAALPLDSVVLSEHVTPSNEANVASIGYRHQREIYLADSMVKELRTEANYIEAHTAALKQQLTQVDVMADNKIHLAESLVKELKAQQRMVKACKAETSYVELCTASSKKSISDGSEALIMEDGHTLDVSDGVNMKVDSGDTAIDWQSTEHAQNELELETHTHPVDETDSSVVSQGNNTLTVTSAGDKDASLVSHDYVSAQDTPPMLAHVVAKVVTCDVSTNTEPHETRSESTNTLTQEFSTQGINTDPPPIVKETGCNTMMNCFDVLQRAKEIEELEFLKVEHQIAVTQMNEAKSQRMVAEQLTKIVQSDLAELRQQNLTETTKRLQLENELSDVKVDLSQTAAQLKEKEERVQELEESLTGTSLLVRKLEEQNAVSMMNRGGIDYMLQAKLAEGRAQEAEQKLEVVQSELLQAQSEVRRLLARVAETSRDRSEMVSSHVHTQLIQIADERVQAAERKSLELEKEVQDLRGRLSIYEIGGGGATSSFATSSGLTGLTRFSGLSTLGSSYSTPGLGSSYSPFSYTSATSKLPSLSEQYNLQSGGLGLFSSSSSAAPPSASSSSFLPFSGTTLSSSTTVSGGSHVKGQGVVGESFASRGTSLISHDTKGIGEAGDDGDRTSRMLKPSEILKKYGSGSHDLTNGRDSTPSVVKKPDHGEVELPSFEATPTKPHSPPKVTFFKDDTLADSDRHGDGDDGDSSDWSSSSDSEGGEGGGDGASGGVMKPSHHTNLIAEWEWRTMNEGGDTSSTHPSSPPTKRRAPPPVAPKPHILLKEAAGFEREIQFEPSTSFDVPTHSAAIQGLQRPRGPQGRNLPSRYRGQQQLVS